MNEFEIGTIQRLSVKRTIETGYVLTDGNTEVLLHTSEAKGQLEDGQLVEVFLYQDKKGKTVATMSIPSINFDTFDWAEVVEVIQGLGVFVNIGIQKEILVSSDDLPKLESVWPQVGDMLYVILDKDKQGKLIAKPVKESDFENNWDKAPATLHNKQIGGRVFRSSKEGAVLITEDGFRGFIHHSEQTKEPRVGEWVNGRVIAVKDDGTLNLSLRPLKQEGMKQDAEAILDYLVKNGGTITLTDKSTPDEIEAVFKISKSAFKRALGKLMREGKIIQQSGTTKLK